MSPYSNSLGTTPRCISRSWVGTPRTWSFRGQGRRFSQLGIMRYCFKTVDHLERLAELKRRGVRVLIENQLGAYNWGDSEWFYFADPDSNILCFEEWFPAGHSGEGLMAPIIEGPVEPHSRTTRSS